MPGLRFFFGDINFQFAPAVQMVGLVHSLALGTQKWKSEI